MNTAHLEPETKTEIKLRLENSIADHPFFKGMELRHLKTLAEAALFTQFDEDQFIVRAGDVANRFYLILEGKVALESAGDDGEPILIQTLEPGDELGWSWMFLPYHWHFDARALEATKAIFFYGTQVRARCEEDHDLGYELMKRVTQVLVRRLEATTGRLLSHH
jgi:CRP-like cAMP-binding protein